MCKEAKILHKLKALCSRHGYIHLPDLRSSGLKVCFDYGPLGTLLRRNIQNEWWKSVVTAQEAMFGSENVQLETLSIANSESESLSCSTDQHAPKRIQACVQDRLDELPLKIESKNETKTQTQWILRNSLRQDVLAHYHYALQLVNRRLPFGLAQIGRCFRGTNLSENTERYLFDLPEFTQMMAHFYCSPKMADRWMIDWQRDRLQWWRKFSGAPGSFQMSETKQSDLLRTTEIQFQFPWGLGTIERISNRGSGDLEKLQQTTTHGMHGREGRRSVLPQVIEMVCELENGILALLLDAYQEKETTPSKSENNYREVLRLHPVLAPIKVVVLPIKGTREISELCEYLAKEFRKSNISCHRVVDTSPVIGQYLTRFDEMGIPFVALFNENTLKTGVVRLRHRDTMIMQQLHITEVRETVQRHLEAG